jgi:hypothetical protein
LWPRESGLPLFRDHAFLSMIFSDLPSPAEASNVRTKVWRSFAQAENRLPPTDQVRGQAFRDHALAGRHFAKQHAAFCLRGSWRLDQRDRDLIGTRAGILDHGLSNVFDQAALLLERAAFQKINDNFRHSSLHCCCRPAAPDHYYLPGAGRACLKIGRVLSESSREGTTGGVRMKRLVFAIGVLALGFSVS